MKSNIAYIDVDNKRNGPVVYMVAYKSGTTRFYTDNNLPKTAADYINGCTSMRRVKYPAVDRDGNFYELVYIRVIA